MWDGVVQRGRGEAAKIPEKTHFHGKEAVDASTGRTWIDAPRDHKKENDTCFLPKVGWALSLLPDPHACRAVSFVLLWFFIAAVACSPIQVVVAWGARGWGWGWGS